MVAIAWLIMDEEFKDDVEFLNDENQAMIPRLIDNVLANNVGEGTLLGLYVAPARLLNDPDYERWYELCSVLPIRTIDSDVLFLPPIEEE